VNGFSRVLVTGGAGFIGSHVVDRLVRMQREVLVIDDLSSGKIENLGSHVALGKVRFFEGDIRDGELVSKLVRGVDAVVHLAAAVSVPFSVENPVLTNDVNVNGTLNLLNACVSADVQRFVLISSCAVYGEPCYLPINEEHPTLPLSPYAASKLAAEAYRIGFGKVHGLDPVVLRLFNVYGSRQREDDAYSGVITKFVNHLIHGKPLVIYGDGAQTRDFVHVENVVEAVLLALENEKAVGETFNVGSGKPTSINELAKLVSEAFGVDAEIIYEKPRAGDLRHSYACISKAEKALGFEPTMSLELGLRSLIRECKEKSNECYALSTA
jgi:UDP-glucose 4-epimerase